FRLESTLWIPLLAIGAGAAGMKTFFLDFPLFLRERVVTHALIVGASAPPSPALPLVFGPRLRGPGAAPADCAAAGLGAAASLAAGQSFARVLPNRRTFVGVTLSCAAMLATARFLVGPTVAQLILAIAASAIVYGAVLWLLDVADARTAPRRI